MDEHFDHEIPNCELKWSSFKAQQFPHRAMNLNPATLGSVPMLAKTFRQRVEESTDSFPLGQYTQGREAMSRSVEIANRIWPAPNHKLQICAGTTQSVNLLLLGALIKHSETSPSGRKIRVLTTAYEHSGGISGFLKHPSFEVGFIGHQKPNDFARLTQLVNEFNPDIAFISHASYLNGAIFPINEWAEVIKSAQPLCCLIIDAAQSLGVLELPFEHADYLIASCHKWLFGPHGLGFLWSRTSPGNSLGQMVWNGETCIESSGDATFDLRGGQNFYSYVELEAALKIHEQIGITQIAKRCLDLAHHCKTLLSRCSGFNRDFFIVNPNEVFGQDSRAFADQSSHHPGLFALEFLTLDPYPIYQTLNERGFYLKCIKTNLPKRRISRLRIGIPFYESKARLETFVNELNSTIQEHI